MINVINRVKATAKNQPFESSEPPTILFTDNQVIAHGKSYISVKLEHDLTDCLLVMDNVIQVLSKFNPENNITITKKPEDSFTKILYKPKRREPTRIKLPVIESERQIEVMPAAVSSKAEILPDNLIKGMKLCQHTLPPNTQEPKYNCFKIGAESILVGGGIRLSVFKCKHNNPFVISDADGLSVISDDYTHYMVKDSSVEFWGKDIYTRIPKLDDKNGPQVKLNTMLKYDNIISVNRQSFIHDLETASIFATGSYDAEYAVFININKNQYLISSKNETGDINSKGKINSGSVETTMKLNPLFLMRALSLFQNDLVDIGISEFKNSHKLVITEDEFSFIMSTYIQEQSNE